LKTNRGGKRRFKKRVQESKKTSEKREMVRPGNQEIAYVKREEKREEDTFDREERDFGMGKVRGKQGEGGFSRRRAKTKTNRRARVAAQTSEAKNSKGKSGEKKKFGSSAPKEIPGGSNTIFLPKSPERGERCSGTNH